MANLLISHQIYVAHQHGRETLQIFVIFHLISYLFKLRLTASGQKLSKLNETHRLEEVPMKILQAQVTAVHQGLSKYLTAQDTHISPTSTNHSRTLSSNGNLLSLQSQSTIQEYKTFSVPSIE